MKIKISFLFVAALLFYGLSQGVSAQGMGELTRCVLQDGNEIYVARDVAEKDLGNFTCKMRQPLGFVYLEQTDSTVALYSLRKITGDKAIYRVLTDGVLFHSLKLGQNGWMAYPGDGIIGYVSFTKVPGTIGAYGFTQTNVKGDQERFRFEGKELDTWGAMKSNSFKSTPSFYIWKQQLFGVGVETFKKLRDITFRQTIYANGSDGFKINFAAKYGTPTKPLTLSCSTAVVTSEKYCQFNIGILLTRTDASAPQQVQVTAIGGVTNVGNTTAFLKGEETTEIVLPVKIKKGKSTVTINLVGLTKEQDENLDNNTFSVKTFVTTN